MKYVAWGMFIVVGLLIVSSLFFGLRRGYRSWKRRRERNQ